MSERGSKKKQREQLTQIVSSLAIKMSGTRWFEIMSIFWKYSFGCVFSQKLDFLTCILMFLVCVVLYIVNLSASMRSCIVFCIYEHILKHIFASFKTYRKTWILVSICINIYIYIHLSLSLSLYIYIYISLSLYIYIYI